VLLHIEVDEFALVDALITAGRLTPEDGLARARVEKVSFGACSSV
jgi:hypothetical protein